MGAMGAPMELGVLCPISNDGKTLASFDDLCSPQLNHYSGLVNVIFVSSRKFNTALRTWCWV